MCSRVYARDAYIKDKTAGTDHTSQSYRLALSGTATRGGGGGGLGRLLHPCTQTHTLKRSHKTRKALVTQFIRSQPKSKWSTRAVGRENKGREKGTGERRPEKMVARKTMKTKRRKTKGREISSKDKTRPSCPQVLGTVTSMLRRCSAHGEQHADDGDCKMKKKKNVKVRERREKANLHMYSPPPKKTTTTRKSKSARRFIRCLRGTLLQARAGARRGGIEGGASTRRWPRRADRCETPRRTEKGAAQGRWEGPKCSVCPTAG